MSHGDHADICVRADWPRLAGTIERASGDYFWSDVHGQQQRELLSSGQQIPIEGSAVIRLHQSSPLCDSALLTLMPPHRFDQHVDGVVLVNETLLVGPGDDCHVQHRESQDRAVIVRRGNQWLAKAGLAGDYEQLCPGRRTMLRSLALTLEEV